MKFNFESPQNKAPEPEKELVQDPEIKKNSIWKKIRNLIVAGSTLAMVTPAVAQEGKNKDTEKPPIFVENKKDKRLLSYEDSLHAWKQSQYAEKLYQILVPKDGSWNWMKMHEDVQRFTKTDIADLEKKMRSIEVLYTKTQNENIDLVQKYNFIKDETKWEPAYKKVKLLLDGFSKSMDELRDKQYNTELKLLKNFQIRWQNFNNPKERTIDQGYDITLYSKRNLKPSKFVGDPGKSNILSGEARYIEYPIFSKPIQPYLYKKPEIKKDTVVIKQKPPEQRALEKKSESPLPAQEKVFTPEGNPIYGPNGHMIGFYSYDINTFTLIPKAYAPKYAMHEEDYYYDKDGNIEIPDTLKTFLQKNLKMNNIKIKKPD